MSYLFKVNEDAGEGIKRMVLDQIEQALSEIQDGSLNPHATVHQLRKRCKKIRALLRLARGDLKTEDGNRYKQENRHYRDAARTLAYARDAAARVATLDDLLHRFENQLEVDRLENVRQFLQERKDEAVAREKAFADAMDSFALALQRGRERVRGWPIGSGFSSIAIGLGKTSRRARKAMRKAYDQPTTENLHDWRKRVKYHRYHVRVLRDSWKPVLNPWRKQLHELSDLLGKDHDLAVLEQALTENRDRFSSGRDVQALLGLSGQWRAQLQEAAFPLGRRLFAERPKHLVRRFEAYWEASHVEEPLGPSEKASGLLSGR